MKGRHDFVSDEYVAIDSNFFVTIPREDYERCQIYGTHGPIGVFYPHKLMLANTAYGPIDKFENKLELSVEEFDEKARNLEEVIAYWHKNRQGWAGYLASGSSMRGHTGYLYYSPGSSDQIPKSVPKDALQNPERYGLLPLHEETRKIDDIAIELERCKIRMYRGKQNLCLRYHEVDEVLGLIGKYKQFISQTV